MKKILGKITSILSPHSKRNWEDAGLLLSAKSVMNSEAWSKAPDFNNPHWIQEKEFRVYSQFGDDGIIQWLIKYLDLTSDGRFIEFGVGDYFESNTHFLLINNRWEGFVMDGDKNNIQSVRDSSIYWRFKLNAQQHFITKENIQELITDSGYNKIELLHIDLDGNDYWILEALDLNQLRPDILVLEYNSIFGNEKKITVPYDPNFNRFDKHYSGKYSGASLPALNELAVKKGFYFIGCNSAGNNAYFLSSKYLMKVPSTEIISGFQEAGYREARDIDGALTYVTSNTEKELLKGLPVINVTNGLKEIL